MRTCAANLEYVFGTSGCIFTPPVGEPITAAAIIGSQKTQWKHIGMEAELVRQRTVSVDASIVVPERDWTVTIDGKTWTVVATEGYSGSRVTVLVERPEVAEFARPGYRGKTQ
jgi:hypothetical protein